MKITRVLCPQYTKSKFNAIYRVSSPPVTVQDIVTPQM